MELESNAPYWVHDLSPFLIRFSETFGIRYYSLAYIAGFVAAYILFRIYYAKGRSPIDPGRLESLFTALILGVILGARMGYMLLYDFSGLVRNPLSLFAVWEGGMSSHGGFIGVTLAVLWAARRMGISCWTIGDLVVSAAPLGLFFGRVANFINGELWGKPSSVAWAVIFPEAPLERGAPYFFSETLGYLVNPRHPSQLYAAFLEGLVLLAIVQMRFWWGKRGRAPGQLAGEFLCAYGVLRIIGEVFREPDAPAILGLSRGTAYSLVAILIGVAVVMGARTGRLGAGAGDGR